MGEKMGKRVLVAFVKMKKKVACIETERERERDIAQDDLKIGV